MAPEAGVVVHRGDAPDSVDRTMGRLEARARADGLELLLPQVLEAPADTFAPVLGDGDVWDEHLLGPGRGICVVPWCKVRVDHEGRVYPCPHKRRPELAWGNLLQAPLQDIVNGERARHTREQLLAGVAPDDACGRCPYGPEEG